MASRIEWHSPSAFFHISNGPSCLSVRVPDDGVLEALSMDVDATTWVLDVKVAASIFVHSVGVVPDVHLVSGFNGFGVVARLVEVGQTFERRDSDLRSVTGKVRVKEGLVRERLFGVVVDHKMRRKLVNTQSDDVLQSNVVIKAVLRTFFFRQMKS